MGRKKDVLPLKAYDSFIAYVMFVLFVLTKKLLHFKLGLIIG